MAVNEQEYQRVAERELDLLKKALIRAEADADFEVEEQGGVVIVLFDDPPGKFVVTTNSPVQQIWISALSTSYKLSLPGFLATPENRFYGGAFARCEAARYSGILAVCISAFRKTVLCPF